MANTPVNVKDGVRRIGRGSIVTPSEAGGLGARVLRENPARTAWMILLGAFMVFCILAITIPLTVRSYLLYATDARPIELNVVSGAVQLTALTTHEVRPVVNRDLVKEGFRITTDDKSSATLTLYADENVQQALATITLYNNAMLDLTAARVPRFTYSHEPDVLVLNLMAGRIRVSPSRRAARPIQVVVDTPAAKATFGDGSYSLEVRPDETEVATRSGEVDVVALGQHVTIPAGERTRIASGRPPEPPMSVEQDLIANGDFAQGLDRWTVNSFVDVRADAAKDVGIGTVQLVSRDGRQAALFSRRGVEGLHAETEIRQNLNIDVRDFDSLHIAFYVQLLYQSLQGAGMQSSEFPMAVQLSYLDIYGEQRLWTSGFYYKDLDSSLPWPLRNVQKIPPSVWYAYESPNLIDLLSNTRPAHLNWIRFYASGYNYESMVAEADLLVR